MVRPLIDEVIRLAKESKRGVIPKIILEAPTGYGKSISAPLMYEVIKESELAESFLHVLPLRSIVRDIYLCTLLNSLGVIPTGLCGNQTPLSEVRDALRRAKITINDIAYQMGDLMVGELHGGGGVFNKQPLFDAKYVVTTIDSFLYNFFRVPITELQSIKKHYAIPRLRIFISAVYLDEAHVVFEEEDEVSTIYTAMNKALEVLYVSKTPLIVASATLGKSILKSLVSSFKNDVKVVRLGHKDKVENTVTEVLDKEFVDKMTSINWHTKFIKNEDVVVKASEVAKSGLKVLVVRDSVKVAIETYKRLCNRAEGVDIILIHGKMTRGDREKALSKIKNMGDHGVVVSTSVIEAGVNVSFDVLFTDGSRPRSVIQRIGRVCREGGCEEASIYLVEDGGCIDERLRNFIKRTHNEGGEICWRIPFDTPSRHYKGYGPLLDELGEPQQDSKLRTDLEALASPLFVSSSTINEVLEKRSYALTRVGIIDIIVGDSSEMRGWSYSDLVFRGLAAPISLVNNILTSRRDCIVGAIAVWGDEDVEEIRLICSVNELIDGHGFSMKKFVECSRRAYKETTNRSLMHVALLVKNDCYRTEIGFVY